MAKVDLQNWKTQIRKGYLELCILTLIEKSQRAYGFEILDRLNNWELLVKEGTLYPLLNRMTTDGILKSTWETEAAKGHPRKFYALTARGKETLTQMTEEFEKMTKIQKEIGKNNQEKSGEKNDEPSIA
ncbi:MAG: PadR family transcriptional regulator [Bdellovibrionales bacterium]|nr:PadR family transcriptional regulator [Bdellovibrionales bacterium]